MYSNDVFDTSIYWQVANVGAEEYFSDQAAKPPQFDKVLLKDAVVFIDNPRETYTNIMKTLTRYGKVCILELVFPSFALTRVSHLAIHTKTATFSLSRW